MPTVLKSGNLNLLETSGPLQACNGITLPLPYVLEGGSAFFLRRKLSGGPLRYFQSLVQWLTLILSKGSVSKYRLCASVCPLVCRTQLLVDESTEIAY